MRHNGKEYQVSTCNLLEGDGKDLKHASIDFDAPLRLQNVYYRYGAGEADVVRGANITINPGEMVALVGPSGGGKTTLIKMMMGLFAPTHGKIYIGETSLSSVDLRKYRSQIGSVAQDDMLYAGSLADNIAFFDLDQDMERVERAARIACIYDDIKTMPLAFDTLVGDMGSTLSGGQKQRVLLARALYAEPKILFIDEGTAHLDPEVEDKLLGNLAELKITRITIAHRSKAIEMADRTIAVMSGFVREARLPDCIEGVSADAA